MSDKARFAGERTALLMDKINEGFKGDPEAAHGSEDALMLEIIRELANGNREVAWAMARAFLHKRDPEAKRWCA